MYHPKHLYLLPCVPLLKKLAYPCSSSSINQCHYFFSHRKISCFGYKSERSRPRHARAQTCTFAHNPCAHYHFSCASAFPLPFIMASFVCKMIANPLANYQQRIPNPLSPPCASLLCSSVFSPNLWWNWSQGPVDKWIEESFCDGGEDGEGQMKGRDGTLLPWAISSCNEKSE